MADFLLDIIDEHKLSVSNELLDHAEKIVGTTIINSINVCV